MPNNFPTYTDLYTLVEAIGQKFADSGGGSIVSTSYLLTLTTSGWNSETKQQTVEYELNTDNRNVVDITVGELPLWSTYNVYAVSETATGITFQCDSIPEEDLTFRITSMEKVEEKEPVKIVTWATGTDAEIKKMIAAADRGEIDLTDYWSVGDERTVNLSAMAASDGTVTVGETHAAQTVTMVIMNQGYNVSGCDNSYVHFVVGLKNSLNEKGYMNSTDTNAGGWKNCARRGWCNSIFYASFPDSIKPIFKLFNTKTANGGYTNYSAIDTTEDRFALFAGREVFDTDTSQGYNYTYNGVTCGGGYSRMEESNVLSQITWYATASNRIKQINGSNNGWWERSPNCHYAHSFCNVSNVAAASYATAGGPFGLAPFGCI